MSTEGADTDILVVGAGPVGLTVAIELARRGIAVRIIDSLAAPTDESRAVVVHSRTLDHFQAMGVLDRIMDGSIISNGMEVHSQGRTIASIGFDHIRAVHPYSVSLVQSETEAALASRLTQLGVAVERCSTLSDLREFDGWVEATISDDCGVTMPIRARYLVGADGARSRVRHLTGQQLDGSFVGDEVVLGDIDADHDYERSHFHAFFSPGEMTALLFPLQGRRVRVFAQLPPGTNTQMGVTAEFVQDVMDRCGIELRITATHWLTHFMLKHGQVERYRSGRVFLAGDAAHIHSPAGALGMNTGIQDSINLGWKLATAIRSGEGCNRLLDSYHDERHPIGAGVVALTTSITKIATINDPLVQRLRNTLMHLGVHATPVTDRMADMIEQQHVRYRNSAIVSGGGHRLRPGDFLYVPGLNIGAALAHTDGHLSLALDDTLSTDETPAIPQLELSVADSVHLRNAAGLSSGGVVIVRPDGYIGFIGADVEQGVRNYLGQLMSG